MSTMLKKCANNISIHAPRAGSDGQDGEYIDVTDISIHAPRAGSDKRDALIKRKDYDFNPRSPCGERLIIDAQ